MLPELLFNRIVELTDGDDAFLVTLNTIIYFFPETIDEDKEIGLFVVESRKQVLVNPSPCVRRLASVISSEPAE
jgi:hypothetical protein